MPPAVSAIDTLILEQEALHLREALLRFFMARQADQSLSVIAMADAIALSAVEHDLDHGQRSLQDRLDLVCRRIEQTYAAAYPAMSAARIARAKAQGAGARQ